MTPPSSTEIREMLLQIAEEIRPKNQFDGSMQLNTLFTKIKERLEGRFAPYTEENILTEWHDLMNTGYFAWGLKLSNPNPPFFHFTERGLKAVVRLSRDPGNTAGYVRHLQTVAKLNPIADSYVREGLECFKLGLYKSAAVMIGGASESLILELRDTTIDKLNQLKIQVPKNLNDWRVKTITDSLNEFLTGKKKDFPKELRDVFEAYFLAFAQQIRTTRNDAGHPSSIDPVTEETVHASFLLYPELAQLTNKLCDWIISSLK